MIKNYKKTGAGAARSSKSKRIDLKSAGRKKLQSRERIPLEWTDTASAAEEWDLAAIITSPFANDHHVNSKRRKDRRSKAEISKTIKRSRKKTALVISENTGNRRKTEKGKYEDNEPISNWKKLNEEYTKFTSPSRPPQMLLVPTKKKVHSTTSRPWESKSSHRRRTRMMNDERYLDDILDGEDCPLESFNRGVECRRVFGPHGRLAIVRPPATSPSRPYRPVSQPSPCHKPLRCKRDTKEDYFNTSGQESNFVMRLFDNWDKEDERDDDNDSYSDRHSCESESMMGTTIDTMRHTARHVPIPPPARNKQQKEKGTGQAVKTNYAMITFGRLLDWVLDCIPDSACSSLVPSSHSIYWDESTFR